MLQEEGKEQEKGQERTLLGNQQEANHLVKLVSCVPVFSLGLICYKILPQKDGW